MPIYLLILWKNIFELYTDPIPDYLRRYMDDCVGTTSCSRVVLDIFNFISIRSNALVTSVVKPIESQSYHIFASFSGASA